MADWRPISDPPPLESVWPGGLESAPVLCFFKSGCMNVVYLRADPEGVYSPQWVTNDSESWDVTGSVTHWMPLPPPPTNLNETKG